MSEFSVTRSERAQRMRVQHIPVAGVKGHEALSRLSSLEVQIINTKKRGKWILETGEMPCLTLYTNLSLLEVDTSALLADVTRAVADVIQKPLNYVMVILKGSVPICVGGTEQPAAYGELVSVGGIDPVTNKKVNAAIATILSKKLSVPKSRFFLLFYESKTNPAQELAHCLHALHQE